VQTTLLGIAIAVILALVTALVGPLFINWNDHRALFEAEASRLIGLPVRVAGAIDARLLPTPSVTLRGIAIGQPGEETRLRAAALGFTLGLGSLLRGELRAVELRLFGPELRLGLDRSGGLDWPGLAMGFDRETLSIERLTIAEGRAILTDAGSGARLVLDKLSFKGEVRSLIGPLRGEGAFVIADGRFGYRISTSRLGEDGLKFKLSVDAEQPLTIEADGALTFDQAAPRFEGNLALARPAGSVLASGKAAINEPWRASSRLKVTTAAALFEQIEFQYGPEERAVKLNGAAEIEFGVQPRLQGTLSARHVDLDRLIAGPSAQRRLPFAAVKTLADMFGGLLRPAWPTQLAIRIDAMTLGGATLQAVGSDLRTQGEAWQIDKLEFRAPGFTQISVNGRLDPIDKGFGFAGHVRVDAGDSMALLTWLTGRSSPTSGPIKAWQARGDVMLSADRIAVERLQAEVARAPLEGRLAYRWPAGDRPARLEAELGAAEFDIDAMLQFADAAFAGMELQRPGELALALELGRARIAGLEARKTTVHLNLDGGGLDLQRLSVEDFGGAALRASGRLDTQSSSPRGNIAVDLDARDLGGVIALAEKFAPPVAEALRRLAGPHSSAKLRATLDMAGAPANAATAHATAKLDIAGHIGAVRVNVAVGATGDPGALAAADVRVEGQLDADDGAALLALIGLDRIAVADKQPGRITLTAAGPLNRDIRIDGKIVAAPIEANGQGVVHFLGDQPVIAKFDQFAGTIGGSKVQGQLALTFGAPMRLDGRIDIDWLDAPAVLAVAFGMPAQRTARNAALAWSLEPFAPSLSNLTGRIEITAARAGFAPKLVAQPLRGVLRSEASQIAFEELEGGLAGGRFTGQLAFVSSLAGFAARGQIALAGAEIATLVPVEGRPPVTGRLALQAALEGVGLSPAAFVGSLHGGGTITIEDAQVAGLNPQVFDELIRAVDLGIRTDANQIREFVTALLDQGYLSVRQANGTIAIAAGQARVIESHVQAKGADLAVAASLDLSKATFDAMVTLSGLPVVSTAGRPTISVALKGPLAAPKSTINTDSLSGWLALRSVEQQSERLDTLEAARRATTIQIPATLPALIAIPATPTVRSKGENASSPPKQTTMETTGAISDANQAPPLPPPITIQPGKKRPEGRRAPPRGENAQSP